MSTTHPSVSITHSRVHSVELLPRSRGIGQERPAFWVGVRLNDDPGDQTIIGHVADTGVSWAATPTVYVGWDRRCRYTRDEAATALVLSWLAERDRD